MQSLPAAEQSLLQFVSLLYEPVSTDFLVRTLPSLPAHFFASTRPGSEEIRKIIARLRQLGLLDKKNQCPPVLAELLSRQALQSGHLSAMASLVERLAPVDYMHGKWPTRCWRALRQFRIGVFSEDFDKMDEALGFFERECHEHLQTLPPALLIAAQAFDPLWFGSLPVFLQFFLLEQVIRYAQEHLLTVPDILSYLEDEQHLRVPLDERVPFRRILAGCYLLQGRLDDLHALLEQHASSFFGSGFLGTLAFLQGRLDESLELFVKDLEQLRGYTGRNDSFFFGITALFCIFALLARDQEGDRELARRSTTMALDLCKNCSEEIPFRFLDAFLHSPQELMPDLLGLTETLAEDGRSLPTLISIMALHWMGIELPEKFQDILADLHNQSQNHGYLWVAMESACLLSILDSNNTAMQEAAQDLSRCLGCRRFLSDIVVPNRSWKQSLQELLEVSGRLRETEQRTRLIWLVEYADDTLSLLPREQKKTTSGQWSKGRNISINRLLTASDTKFRDFTYFTEQDRLILAALMPIDQESGGKASLLVFDNEKALPALISHPLVYLRQSPQVPVEIVAGEPELVVERRGESIFIHFLQNIGKGKVAIWQETPTRFRIIRISDEHRKVAAITGQDGLLVPLAASQQVLDAIGNIASFMTVHSAIEVHPEEQSAEAVESDSTIHIHIIPYGSGFRIELFVRPFAKGGPYLKPGVGVTNLMAEINGQRLRTKRDLSLEEEKAREVEESCPMLDLAIDFEQENKREWHLLDPEECLQVLLEIQEIRHKVILEWPEGEKLAVRRRVGVNQLNLNIRTSQQEWFHISGKLQIDQDEVMELKTLLEKVKEHRSRFIPLGDGQFLALTQEFRNRLEELILYSGPGGKDEELRIHPLASLALEDLTHQVKHTDADAGWRARIRAISEAQDLNPKLPSTLKAELRDYQREGFVWMQRLAHIGVGACLADDMGLGKTLQSIAMILSRAHQGPSLVVAPTSVCMNWEAEVARFAPTLNFHMFSEANRDAVTPTLSKFDLLMTSYTLLQQEIELLEKVDWQTIVLDEAQAIKNAATKRSKAAMRLRGRFRMLTTGTPIENHLGELWNLFCFINPGLLGSFKQFNRRFGIPIEKYHDRDARKALKKLIRPFILRRIKSQVLDELPSRTEITLRVEMQPREIQFYEALRQQALENIEGSTEKSGRHLRILAEIMHLRRACCHPRLIDPQLDIPSSKLQVFGEVVEELLAGGHKALVFSQFTGHLALIREYLDQQGISYKYLDGSTPNRERQQQVESFQAGEGELFLISLKAGGLGLNLTAADYVIHMDPWWNPAVEDQAADRAHRIGQKRPVTVYRLVTVNTIEEKIVRLHQEKRDLANSLLEGADVSARVSAEELLELIRSA